MAIISSHLQLVAHVHLFLVFALAILLRIRIVVAVRRLKGGQIEQGRFAASRRRRRSDRHDRDRPVRVRHRRCCRRRRRRRFGDQITVGANTRFAPRPNREARALCNTGPK